MEMGLHISPELDHCCSILPELQGQTEAGQENFMTINMNKYKGGIRFSIVGHSERLSCDLEK